MRIKNCAGHVFVSALFLLATIPSLTAAQFGDFTYDVIDYDKCAITGFMGSGGDVDIPNSITDGDRTYIVTEIAAGIFKGCTTLTGVTIPGGVTVIGDEAFCGCCLLTRVIVPARVTNISSNMFQSCSNLTSVTISARKVSVIESGAFSSCTSLSSVYFLGDYPSSVWSDIFTDTTNATVFYQPQKIGWSSTLAGRPTAQLPFKYLVTVDGKASFCGFGSEATGEVMVPAEAGGYPITDVGGQAFHGCVGMTHVTIPTNVVSIGIGAFAGCAGLADIAIPDSVTNIGRYAFADCASLRNVTLGPSVTSIGTGAFSGCRGLTGVAIPASVDSIGDQAFDSCSGVAAITGLSGVTRIGSGVFSGCSGLSGLAIPDGVTNIGWWAFSDCAGLTEISISANVTLIGDYAFSGCSSITGFSVDGANANYSSLEGALLNKTQTVLIKCPGGVTGKYTVPSSVGTIENEAFSDCSGITEFSVDGANANYSSLDGFLFNKDQTVLIRCPGGLTGDHTIPSSTVAIGSEAFLGCTGLHGVSISPGVVSVGDWAFDSCSTLAWLSIPASVTSMGDCVFGSCTDLEGVYFKGNAPSSVGLSFTGSGAAAIYYLRGATGWGDPIVERMPVAWEPRVQSGPGLGHNGDGLFGFTVLGTNGMTVAVEACTNLADAVWLPVSTIALTNGAAVFTDAASVGLSARYYRFSMP